MPHRRSDWLQAYGDLMSRSATGVRRGAASQSPKATKVTGRHPMWQGKSRDCGGAVGQKLGVGNIGQNRPLSALADEKQTVPQERIGALIAHPGTAVVRGWCAPARRSQR
jgi:hypothetical protein